MALWLTSIGVPDETSRGLVFGVVRSGQVRPGFRLPLHSNRTSTLTRRSMNSYVQLQEEGRGTPTGLSTSSALSRPHGQRRWA